MSFDKWFFLLGILFLIVFFLIRRKEKKISKVLFAFAIIILFAPLYLPRQILGKWDSVKTLKGKVVRSILLQPSQPEWQVNLTDSSINVFNKYEIYHIIDLLQKTEIYYPNHPTRIWETKMIFITTDGDSLTLKIEKTENNGTVIYSRDKKFRKDELAKFLEKITNFTSPHFSYEFEKK